VLPRRSEPFYNPAMRKESKRKSRTHRSASMPERVTETPVQAEAPTPDPPPASTQTDAGSRIAFPTKADGTLDDESIRSATKEKLRIVFSDPHLAEKLGIDRPTSSSPDAMKIPIAFFEKAADMIHDTIGKLAVVAVVRNGYPLDEAKAMLLTDEDKKILNPLAAQALDDWCPSIEGKYQSLALLGAGYISIFGSKFASMKKPGEVIQFPQAQQPIQSEP